jgi:hypothetical protein
MTVSCLGLVNQDNANTQAPSKQAKDDNQPSDVKNTALTPKIASH